MRYLWHPLGSLVGVFEFDGLYGQMRASGASMAISTSATVAEVPTRARP